MNYLRRYVSGDTMNTPTFVQCVIQPWVISGWLPHQTLSPNTQLRPGQSHCSYVRNSPKGIHHTNFGIKPAQRCCSDLLSFPWFLKTELQELRKWLSVVTVKSGEAHQVHHTHGLTCHYYSLPALSLPCRWKHSGNPGPDNGGQIRTLEHHQVILFGLANTSQVPIPLSARPWAEHSIFEKTQTFPQRI